LHFEQHTRMVLHFGHRNLWNVFSPLNMHCLTGFPHLRFVDRIPVNPSVEFVVPTVLRLTARPSSY
jgi:hypothetical protein